MITGRDLDRAAAVAAAIAGPGTVSACAADLSDAARARRVRRAASARSTASSSVRSIATRTPSPTTTSARAIRLVTLKLVGYTEVVHTLLPRLSADASILLFGGLALRRPYPGSTTVSTVNGGVTGLVHTIAVELAPIRVNGIHPGIVGDSPYWEDKQRRSRRGQRAHAAR